MSHKSNLISAAATVVASEGAPSVAALSSSFNNLVSSLSSNDVPSSAEDSSSTTSSEDISSVPSDAGTDTDSVEGITMTLKQRNLHEMTIPIPVRAENLKLKLGSSSCLLANPVRWNGGHSQAKYLTKMLSDFVEYVPTCPEVGIGMGTPRETIRLVGDIEDVANNTVKVFGGKSAIDYTDKMLEYSYNKVKELRAQGIDGFVLKSKSPSCGLRVKVHSEWDSKGGNGTKNMGVFARILTQEWPELPITEEGRLNDLNLREQFLTSAYSHHRWANGVNRNSIESIAQFHMQHRYLLMSYNPLILRQLDGEVEDATDANTLYSFYYSTFFKALTRFDGPREQRKADTLKTMVDTFIDKLDDEDASELTEAIEDVRKSVVPVAVPLALIKHYIRRFDLTSLKSQVFMCATPGALKLQSHIDLSY